MLDRYIHRERERDSDGIELFAWCQRGEAEVTPFVSGEDVERSLWQVREEKSQPP